MGRIAILDDSTIAQIAAGEIIERPASVVKELLENSLDAGASRISVELEQGGCHTITVADDGDGMDAEDAVLALQRHTTSKIRTAADVPEALTFGFRGEALASIAAISVLELETRPRGALAGVRLHVKAGTITDLREVGTPQGTRITVRHLFHNAPVRRRALRSPTTELAHVLDCVAQCALSSPKTYLRLLHAGETIFVSPGESALLDVITAVFGAETARHMVPVAEETQECTVSGYLSLPPVTRASRACQWFFVNRRPVRSKTIAHAVEQGYRAFLPSGRHPIAVLFIQMDRALVDVNVHPAKREVRFLRERDLHQALSRALRTALEKAFSPDGSSSSFASHAGGPLSHPATRASVVAPTPSPTESHSSAAGMPGSEPPQARAQIHDTYILAEGKEGLLVIDQHSAHERALYDQILSGTAGDFTHPHPLPVPFVLTLEPHHHAAIGQQAAMLRSFGFVLDPFGRHSYLVRAVPAALAGADCEALLRETAAELAAEREPIPLTACRERIASLLACRSAVKAGDRLTLQEMQAIVQSLYALQSPNMCQHGRPTAILFSRDELDKRFQR